MCYVSEIERKPNLTSIWDKDTAYDYISWDEIQKMSEDKVQDFYYLLNKENRANIE